MGDTSNETIKLDLSGLVDNQSDHDEIQQQSPRCAGTQFVTDLIADYRCRSWDKSHEPTRESPKASNRSGQQLRSVSPATRAHRAMDAICAAENSKARIYEISGRSPGGNERELPHPSGADGMEDLSKGFAHSMLVDETFMFVAGHIDASTKAKIAKGEYVRFSKLIAKDKVEIEEDSQIEIINKDGKPVWVPVSDRDQTAINGFGKWDQAFRVYSDIYLKTNPHRAPELIQYTHVIHTASLSHHWENVYKYDRLFQLHMEQNPSRNWGIILQ